MYSVLVNKMSQSTLGIKNMSQLHCLEAIKVLLGQDIGWSIYSVQVELWAVPLNTYTEVVYK